jgi:DNA-binding transcriptional ArsR family regulator
MPGKLAGRGAAAGGVGRPGSIGEGLWAGAMLAEVSRGLDSRGRSRKQQIPMSKKVARRPAPRGAGQGMPRAIARTGLRRPEKAAFPAALAAAPASASRWTFLTNHSHVLILLWQDPSIVLREVAIRVGITERAVQRIIADLEGAGFIEREKVGRRNHYRIRTNRPLRHPIEAHRTIGDLVGLI